MSLFLGGETHEQRVELYLQEIIRINRAMAFLLVQISDVDLSREDLDAFSLNAMGEGG